MKMQLLSEYPPKDQSNMSQSLIDTADPTSECEGASATVVAAVARAEGIDSTTLLTPLYEAIDPDALDDLFASNPDGHPASSIRVRFTYYGYDVEVYGDGDVILNKQ